MPGEPNMPSNTHKYLLLELKYSSKQQQIKRLLKKTIDWMLSAKVTTAFISYFLLHSATSLFYQEALQNAEYFPKKWVEITRPILNHIQYRWSALKLTFGITA